jgi:hypothetical protein
MSRSKSTIVKRYHAILFLLLSTAVVSCSPSLKVTSDYDSNVNFTQFKTFRMERPSDASQQSVSQLNQDRVFKAVRAEMIKKNFIEAADSADLIVHTVTIFKDMQSVSSSTNYYGYGGYYRPYGWGGGMASGHTTYNVQNYKDGSLIIEVIDAATRKLVWEGVGNKEIDKPSKNPDKDIPDAVASIMAQFPPPIEKKK